MTAAGNAYLAQGAASALEDAVILSRCLARAKGKRSSRGRLRSSSCICDADVSDWFGRDRMEDPQSGRYVACRAFVWEASGACPIRLWPTRDLFAVILIYNLFKSFKLKEIILIIIIKILNTFN